MLQNRDVKAKPTNIGGRIFFVLFDEEDGHTYPHGIVMCPPGMRHYEADNKIHNSFRKVVRRNPDTWDWEQVIQQLEDDGFQHFVAGYWVTGK